MSRSDIVTAPISVRITLNLPAIRCAALATGAHRTSGSVAVSSAMAERTDIRWDLPVP